MADASGREEKGGAGEKVEAAALYVVVLVCGTVLMSAEIAGSRVLAPYFGSAVFVWGSLIGVIMVALSAGYYAGGRVADRYPSFPLLCGIVAAAGSFLLVMPFFSNAVCGAIERALRGPRAGPLLASVFLFLVPAVLLATVTPFAVRLSAKELSRVGNVAGRLSALSTIGSIAGTLSTAFILITVMGTRILIFTLGAVLVVTAAAGLAAVWRRGRWGLVAGALVLVLGCLVGYPRGPNAELTQTWEAKRNMHHELREWSDSNYHLILVTEQAEYVDPDTGKKRPRRVLRFNKRIQSAIYIDKREGDVATGDETLKAYESAVGYTDLLHLGLIFCPEAESALVVGAGGGIAPTEFTRHYGMKVDVAEIDPEVERISRKWFHVGGRESDRVTFLMGDGRRTLKRLPGSREGGYDLVVLDAYSSGGYIPPHLTTKEFLALCREKLSPRGVLVSNAISALQGKGSAFYESEYLTMYDAGFEQVYTFPRIPTKGEARLRGLAPEDYWKDRSINIILVASQDEGRLTAAEILRRAKRLTERPERPVRIKTFVHYARAYWERSRTREEMVAGMDKGIHLTDDFCPVDLMFAD